MQLLRYLLLTKIFEIIEGNLTADIYLLIWPTQMTSIYTHRILASSLLRVTRFIGDTVTTFDGDRATFNGGGGVRTIVEDILTDCVEIVVVVVFSERIFVIGSILIDTFGITIHPLWLKLNGIT